MINNIRLSHLLVLLLAMMAIACKKGDVIGEDPYAGGKQPLGIKFDNELPDPELAEQGGQVKVLVRGLLKYKDDFKFYVNQTEATVLSFTDSTAIVKVPDNASTGGLSVVVKGQTFFGPVLRIDGKVSIDETFTTQGASYRDNAGNMMQASINDVAVLPSGNMILVGSFNNFDNKWTEKQPNGGIAQITANGSYVAPVTPGFNLGAGVSASGSVQTITRMVGGPHDGKYILTGLFSNFVSPIKKNVRVNMSSVTRINADGKLDTVILDMINPTPNNIAKNQDTVPAFNGGVDGMVRKSFVFNNRLYVVGNFKNYVRRYYDRSTYDSKVLDFIRMNQLACMKINMDDPLREGELDSTFHFDPVTRQSPIAANGQINDAIQLPDGKLVLVGTFTTFNGTPASRIVRLNLDGSVDNTFNTSGGADAEIAKITYNAVTNKILVSGLFKNFGGTAKQGVAMLNTDGSLEASFNFGVLTDGLPTYAGQLNNGNVIVAGNFNTYNGVVRQGFMILKPDASLAPGYNNSGQFVGNISKIVETPAGASTRLTLIGTISRFDNRSYNGIVKILLKN